MIVMRYTARVGFVTVGYTPKVRTSPSVAIYNGFVYNVTTYLPTGYYVICRHPGTQGRYKTWE